MRKYEEVRGSRSSLLPAPLTCAVLHVHRRDLVSLRLYLHRQVVALAFQTRHALPQTLASATVRGMGRDGS